MCMTDRMEIEQLFKEHYAGLWRLAMALLHDPEAARDVVHDLFAALLHAAPAHVSAAYLATGVRNRCLNYLRDKDARTRLAARYFLETEQYDTEEWPDEAVLTRISDIISRELPPQCRRVTEMRFTQGLKPQEIASELGVSERAVFKHLRHALIVIRKKLNENG